ncbi:hydroxyacid-oxoacid transhydrogenase, mitochondrial-like [Varroa jacobsoni]|uniref:Probable hydroxyacid-oxoacid transhydrogenase, mitochondrial n=1 Tax=Varroa destructor TaxID=109461 RepID=A0A7M7KAA5_VARDE|nr:hydroxyacid-oxoacid transhydrogenase, mitochondrial-like [Varroa destructor]XP_022695197.1 hydroxyacid-oxoacid transhydrogenase, mitochondrial-like [Varroa jacobsoni]
MSRAIDLLRVMASVQRRCPGHHHIGNALLSSTGSCSQSKDYAFEMACSNIRYGPGVTREVGQDLNNMNAKKVCVVTDKNLLKLPPVRAVLDSLHANKVVYELFSDVSVEPTYNSFQKAINFARTGGFDSFVAVGGGSVIDTTKAANLYTCNPEAEFLDFVNIPIGKGFPIRNALKPLIAIPTTAGTGSETTGVAIFDYEPLKSKTGIASRALKPTLALVDPLHLKHMPERVAAFSGFDVLCHALESFTAIPFNERQPCPDDPIKRPAYQGSNPISDVWAKHVFEILRKYFKRNVFNPEDYEARSAMHLASCYAGIGFGNAGVHLCHGMSYPISGLVKNFVAKDYESSEKPIIPHGLAVVMTSPAVFKFTAPACPDRHLLAIELLGGRDTRGLKQADAGPVLADVLRDYMSDMKIENGLSALGYDKSDIDSLVEKTLPQERVTRLAPRSHVESDLANIFEQSMTIF